jgi:WD40 repeat protein
MAVRLIRCWLAVGLLFAFGHLASAQFKSEVRLEPLTPPSTSPETLPEDAILRIGSLRFRDGGQIYGATVSPDGKILATSSHNAYVRLLDLQTGKELSRFTVPNGFRNNTLQFTGDGKFLITYGYNGTSFWRVEDGKIDKTIPVDPNRQREGMTSTSGDGRIMAVMTPDYNTTKGKAQVVDLEKSKTLCDLETLHNNSLFATLSQDGKMMMTWGVFYDRNNNNNPNPENHNGTVQLWDTTTGKEKAKLKSETYNIFACKFSPDEKRAVTAGNGVIQIWDLATGKSEKRFASRASQGSQITFSHDGKILAAASNRDSTIQTWEIASGKRLGTYEGPPQTITSGMVYRADGELIAWGLSGSLIHVWEVASGKRLTPSSGHSAPISGLLFAEGGKTLVSTAHDGKMLTWDPKTGQEQSQIALKADEDQRRYYRGPRGGYYNNGFPGSAVFSPNGKYMLGNNNDYGTMSIFELPSGMEVFALSSPNNYIDRNGPTIFSPDSTKVTSLSRYASPQRQGIPIWDLETGLPLPLLKGQNGEFCSGAFSPDGKSFASASVNYNGNGQVCEIWVWDLATGKERVKFSQNTGYCNAMTFLDDRRIVAASPTGWRIYDSLTGKEIGAFDGTMTQVTSAPVISPDGRLIAIGVTTPDAYTRENVRIAGKSKVMVWEIASASLRFEYTGHEGQVTSLTFSPDGKTLASGGQDTTILLWDLSGKRTPKSAALSSSELAQLWASLKERPGKEAETVLRKLAGQPSESVNFLRENLKPIAGKKISDETIKGLLVNLESPRFAVREKASKEIEALGKLTLTHLVSLQRGNPTPDLQRRLEKLVEVIDRIDDSLLFVRELRGIELLERINTPEAKALLKDLANGATGALPTVAAQAALARMK